MRTFKERVATNRKWWVTATTISLAFLLAMGFGFGSLILQLPTSYQPNLIYAFGGLFIVIAFFIGQSTDRILIRSWDTWLGELGPTQIEVLIPVLKEQREKLVKENGK